MKGAVFYGKEDLRIEELPIPTPKDGEVLIKVKACGICGTDMHIFDGDEGAAPTPSGTVLGHEFSGTVVSVGTGVTNVAEGDTVCVDPNKLCGGCTSCLNGIGHFCENMIGIGTTVNGGFAEYCCVPYTQVYKATGCDFVRAAMTEPVACCLHGMDMCGIEQGDTVAIIGGGMIGLLMLQLARLKGAATLIVSEPIESKRLLAQRLGADIVIDPTVQNPAEVLKERGLTRVNAVIECVGRTATMEQAVATAGNKSTVMLFGLTSPDARMEIKPFEIFKKELTIKSSFINPYTQTRALNLITSGKIDIDALIHGNASVDELPLILKDKRRRAEGKWVITF